MVCSIFLTSIIGNITLGWYMTVLYMRSEVIGSWQFPASCLQGALTVCLLQSLKVCTTTTLELATPWKTLVIYHLRNGENAQFLDGNQWQRFRRPPSSTLTNMGSRLVLGLSIDSSVSTCRAEQQDPNWNGFLLTLMCTGDSRWHTDILCLCAWQECATSLQYSPLEDQIFWELSSKGVSAAAV